MNLNLRGLRGLRGFVLAAIIIALRPPSAFAEDGYELWLRYQRVADAALLKQYRSTVTGLLVSGESATARATAAELTRGLGGLLDTTIPSVADVVADGALIAGTGRSAVISSLGLDAELRTLGGEGYLIRSVRARGRRATVIAANTDIGVLYGAFHFLRLLQTNQRIDTLGISDRPRIQHRILNHWDNLDGSVERGYAGRSLWDWYTLPGYKSPRYTDYARANASIGINGTVLTNVNANATSLTADYLKKVAALADVFRPYGIRVYLTARFSAPIEIGGLKTADPLAPEVKAWWAAKVAEIYTVIPDFGGLLVKANSEGQPGPQDYKRTHADGANMLAEALERYGGIVMWRAFVYSSENTEDRARQAYSEFVPLDGKFADNVLVQVKNGPIDFQPREPFSPLFGAMPKTPLMMEVQITKEYLGFATHLVYLGTMWEEALDADTLVAGKGSTVAKVIDGDLHGYKLTGMAGVANIGADRNWSGSHFDQANWYAFGRLAWDPELSARAIAEEWVRMTFNSDPAFVRPVVAMMMGSREAVVNYMTPLGLAHIMGTDDHYGPAPWVSNLSTANWNPAYYHKADMTGVGFDRTAAGSNAVSQYFATVRDRFASKTTVGDDFLLFFQRVGWDDKLASSGRSIWEELVYRYSSGVDAVQTMRDAWTMVQGRIDAKRYKDVGDFLLTQHYEARWWRDACLTYFASVNGKAIPAGYAAPAQNLSFYKNLETKCPSDVTKPRCPDVYTGSPSPAILK